MLSDTSVSSTMCFRGLALTERKGRRLTRWLAAIAGLAMMMPAKDAVTCSCVRLDPATAFRYHAVIALVKVKEIESEPDVGPWRITLTVLQSWKGNLSPNTIVPAQTPGPRGACGFFIHAGDEFLIYYDQQLTEMNVGLCNTVRDDDVQIHIRALDAAFQGVALEGGK